MASHTSHTDGSGSESFKKKRRPATEYQVGDFNDPTRIRSVSGLNKNNFRSNVSGIYHSVDRVFECESARVSVTARSVIRVATATAM